MKVCTLFILAAGIFSVTSTSEARHRNLDQTSVLSRVERQGKILEDVRKGRPLNTRRKPPTRTSVSERNKKSSSAPKPHESSNTRDSNTMGTNIGNMNSEEPSGDSHKRDSRKVPSNSFSSELMKRLRMRQDQADYPDENLDVPQSFVDNVGNDYFDSSYSSVHNGIGSSVHDRVGRDLFEAVDSAIQSRVQPDPPSELLTSFTEWPENPDHQNTDYHNDDFVVTVNSEQGNGFYPDRSAQEDNYNRDQHFEESNFNQEERFDDHPDYDENRNDFPREQRNDENYDRPRNVEVEGSRVQEINQNDDDDDSSLDLSDSESSQSERPLPKQEVRKIISASHAKTPSNTEEVSIFTPAGSKRTSIDPSVKCGLLDNSAKRDIQGPKNRRLPKPKHTKQILSQRQEEHVVSPDVGHSPSTIPINTEPFTWNELLMNFKLDPSKYPTVSSAKDNKDLIEYINLNLPALGNDVLLAMDYDCVGVIDWRKADDAFMKRLSEVHASTSKEKNPITALLEVKKNDELNHGDKVSCSFLFFLMLPYFLI